MLKPYLVTMQQPGCVRSRFIVKAEGTFDSLDKVMQRMSVGPNPLNADSYLACRPATAEDQKTHARWDLLN